MPGTKRQSKKEATPLEPRQAPELEVVREEEMITPLDASRLLEISIREVYQLIKDGELVSDKNFAGQKLTLSSVEAVKRKLRGLPEPATKKSRSNSKAAIQAKAEAPTTPNPIVQKSLLAEAPTTPNPTVKKNKPRPKVGPNDVPPFLRNRQIRDIDETPPRMKARTTEEKEKGDNSAVVEHLMKKIEELQEARREDALTIGRLEERIRVLEEQLAASQAPQQEEGYQPSPRFLHKATNKFRNLQ
jgi:hypothetical protein